MHKTLVCSLPHLRSKFLQAAFLHNFQLCNSHTHLLQCYPHPNTIKQIHARIITQGSSQTSFSATHLLKSYAKAGNLETALLVFESVSEKTIFLWNAMIRAFNKNELWEQVTKLYRRMAETMMNVEPDCYTLPFVIKAFSVLGAIEDGKRIHDLADRLGLLGNAYVTTALVEMYVKFGHIGSARQVFDGMLERDVVSWTCMISGYCDCGNCLEAMQVFRDMMTLGDVKPNSVTVLSLIPVCGCSIHAFAMKSGLDFSVEVETAIFDMYAKSGIVENARDLFDHMPWKSLISWTAMLAGYSQNGFAYDALLLFNQMLKSTDLKPDNIVAAIILQACAHLGSINHGEMIHGYTLRSGFESELRVGTALVDMYAKCGGIESAQCVFNGISDKNIITWTVMISGYGIHGFGKKAFDLFEQMKMDGIEPDNTTLLSVLSACSHSGLIREGKKCFDSMMIPQTKHYACMVDLLGRAGLIDEACKLIEEMPGEPDASVWGALLSACRFKGNVEIAEFASRRLLDLDPEDLEYHVLLANVYADRGRWLDASKVRSGMRGRGKGKAKMPGCSYVEVDCIIHLFFAADRSHPQTKNIYQMLELIHSSAMEEYQ